MEKGGCRGGKRLPLLMDVGYEHVLGMGMDDVSLLTPTLNTVSQ